MIDYSFCSNPTSDLAVSKRNECRLFSDVLKEMIAQRWSVRWMIIMMS